MISPTMKSCRIQILALILAGLISMPAHAEVIPGRWEKVSALEMAFAHHSGTEKRESNPGPVPRPVAIRSGTPESRRLGNNSENGHPDDYSSFEGWPRQRSQDWSRDRGRDCSRSRWHSCHGPK